MSTECCYYRCFVCSAYPPGMGDGRRKWLDFCCSLLAAQLPLLLSLSRSLPFATTALVPARISHTDTHRFDCIGAVLANTCRYTQLKFIAEFSLSCSVHICAIRHTPERTSHEMGLHDVDIGIGYDVDEDEEQRSQCSTVVWCEQRDHLTMRFASFRCQTPFIRRNVFGRASSRSLCMPIMWR